MLESRGHLLHLCISSRAETSAWHIVDAHLKCVEQVNLEGKEKGDGTEGVGAAWGAENIQYLHLDGSYVRFT